MGAFENAKGNFVRFGQKGQSDLWGVDKRGVHWEIETKRIGQRPTPMQLEWLKSMTSKGCVAFWIDSANVAERVAESILSGGTIKWLGAGPDYDIIMPEDTTPPLT